MSVRDEILTATSRLFEERGVDGFSMRQIASEIGYSATTIYHHFDDKDALMLAVCQDGFREFGMRLGAAASAATDPLAAIRAVGAAYVDFALAHPVHYDVMFIRPKAWAIGPLEAGPDGSRSDPESFAALVALVTAAQSAGLLRAGDAHEGAARLWAAIHGAAALSVSMGHQLDWLDAARTRDRASALVDAVLASLA